MLKNSNHIKYDPGRGVFGQKIYFEDKKNNRLVKIIICVSEEFLAENLNKHLNEVINNNINDIDIQKWFLVKNDYVLNDINNLIKDNTEDLIIYPYPKIPSMIESAESLFL